jgi:hypothetical protein
MDGRPGEAQSWLDRHQRAWDLDMLAAAICPFGLLARCSGRSSRLHVSDPVDSRNSGLVVVGRDRDGAWWYCWAHGERIAQVGEIEEAARKVARVVPGITG